MITPSIPFSRGSGLVSKFWFMVLLLAVVFGPQPGDCSNALELARQSKSFCDGDFDCSTYKDQLESRELVVYKERPVEAVASIRDLDLSFPQHNPFPYFAKLFKCEADRCSSNVVNKANVIETFQTKLANQNIFNVYNQTTNETDRQQIRQYVQALCTGMILVSYPSKRSFDVYARTVMSVATEGVSVISDYYDEIRDIDPQSGQDVTDAVIESRVLRLFDSLNNDCLTPFLVKNHQLAHIEHMLQASEDWLLHLVFRNDQQTVILKNISETLTDTQTTLNNHVTDSGTHFKAHNRHLIILFVSGCVLLKVVWEFSKTVPGFGQDMALSIVSLSILSFIASVSLFDESHSRELKAMQKVDMTNQYAALIYGVFYSSNLQAFLLSLMPLVLGVSILGTVKVVRFRTCKVFFWVCVCSYAIVFVVHKFEHGTQSWFSRALHYAFEDKMHTPNAMLFSYLIGFGVIWYANTCYPHETGSCPDTLKNELMQELGNVLSGRHNHRFALPVALSVFAGYFEYDDGFNWASAFVVGLAGFIFLAILTLTTESDYYIPEQFDTRWPTARMIETCVAAPLKKAYNRIEFRGPGSNALTHVKSFGTGFQSMIGGAVFGTSRLSVDYEFGLYLHHNSYAEQYSLEKYDVAFIRNALEDMVHFPSEGVAFQIESEYIKRRIDAMNDNLRRMNKNRKTVTFSLQKMQSRVNRSVAAFKYQQKKTDRKEFSDDFGTSSNAIPEIDTSQRYYTRFRARHPRTR